MVCISLKVLFDSTLVVIFSLSRKILTSKKDKKPYFSYVILYRQKILIKFKIKHLANRRKQYKYFIKLTSIVKKPSIFKNITAGFTQDQTKWRSHGYTIYLFMTFEVKREKRFFGAYAKQITKVTLRNFRETLIVVLQVVDANIDSDV